MAVSSIRSPVPPETRPILILIAGFLVVRLAAAAWAGLGVDESYSLAIARQLQLSYFDHPPLHQWIVHALGGLLGYGRWARLPFVGMFAVSTWLLFDLTRRLFGAEAGLWAAFALNVSGFFTAAAGGWVLPDGPLILCLLAAADQTARILFSSKPSETPRATARLGAWLWVGLWLGLAGLSKYQAILVGFGLSGALVLLPQGRAELKRPGPYVAALLALLVVSPVLIWNAQNHWVSFVFQGGRADPAHGLRPQAILKTLLGQSILLLPWIFAPLALASWRAMRAKATSGRQVFCLMLGLPCIVLFALTPIWGETGLPHWAMPGWLFIFPLLGELLAKAADQKTWPRTWAVASLAALAVLWTCAVTETATGWIGRTWPAVFKKGDPTLESIAWNPLAYTLNGMQQQDQTEPFIIAANWSDAGKIGQAMKQGTTIVVGSNDPRGFGYGRRLDSLVGRDAVIVMHGEPNPGELDSLRPCFASLDPIRTVAFGRGHAAEITLRLVYAHRLQASCQALGRTDPASMARGLFLR